MPNDPRVKFHKGGKICRKDIEYLRKHPECYGFVKHNAAFGSGRGNRSIFEDGTPPDRPPGDGDPPTQTDTTTTTATDFVGVPLGSPQFNAGEITGITIGALAAGATLELTRRAYLEYLEEERRRRGMQPVSQRDAPIKPRKGGRLLERTRAGVRGISTAIQSLEMTSRPARPAAPIQSEFAALSVESSPSSSGASTPNARSRSSAGSSADLQSARSRPAPAPASRADPTINDPNRLSSVFTTDTGTIGVAPKQTIKPPPSRNPDVALDLQNELEMRQLELNIENARIVPDDRYFYLTEEAPPHRLPREGISEGRKNKLKSEIKALERAIEMTKLRPAPAPAPERPTALAQSEFGRGSYELQGRSLIPPITPEEQLRFDLLNQSELHLTPPDTPESLSSGQRTPPEMAAAMDRLDAMASRDSEITLMLANTELPPEIRRQLREEQITLNEAYNKELELSKGSSSAMIEQQKLDAAFEAAQSKAGLKSLKKVQSALKTIKETPASNRRRISKTITPETPIANNPVNDRINAARPTQAIEMTETGLRANAPLVESAASTSIVEVKAQVASTIEETRASMQRATTRKPATPVVKVEKIPKPPAISSAGKAALERARAASASTSEVEMRPVVQQVTAPAPESRAKLSPAEYRQLLEGLPEDEILEMERLRERLAKLTSDEMPAQERPQPAQPTQERPQPAPERPAPVEAPVERPPAPVEAPVERPAPRPLRPQEDFGMELGDAAGLTFRDRPLDRFNNMYDLMTERWRAHYSDSIPTAPEGMTEIQGKKYIMEQIVKEQAANGDPIMAGETTQVEITLEEALDRVQTAYDRTDQPISEEIATKKSLKPDKKRKLTKQTELLATEEQRLRPTALAGEAQARVQSRAATGTSTAPEARAAAPEMRATAPEARAMSAAPEMVTPEVAARRRMGVPELTAPPPAAPRETASFAERRAFFEETSRVKPPTKGEPLQPPETASGAAPRGEPAPSAPPSAPESEIQTPREGAIREQTPAERAAFAEELTGRLSTKKVPGRQKAKINFGKSNTTTKNPLDIFVSPQYRNTPSIELHPGAKNLRGALSELGSRVPKLVPTKAKLISMGTNVAAEGGGAIAGYFVGSFAGQKMSEFFATHPPKNRGDEYGQALATSMVALGVGNLTAKVVSYVIKQGVQFAVIGEVSGSVSSAGAAGVTALAEAAAFATIATTTQYFTTKALEDAGHSHSYSRKVGALAATDALLAADLAAFALKGGPLNPYATGSLLVSSVMIIGFGIWSYFEEEKLGAEQDEAEREQRDEIERARQEREDTILGIVNTNDLRGNFILNLWKYDYDFDKAYAALSRDDKGMMGILTPEGKASFQAQVESSFDPFNAFQESPPGVEAPVVLTGVEKDRRDVFNEYINWYINRLRGDTITAFNANDPRVKELEEYSGGTWQSAAAVTAITNYAQSERIHPLIENAQNEIINAFHKERKTIEEMDPEVVRYANLDPGFRNGYEAYIVSEAQSQILIEFNRTQFTYNDVDPKLLAIADRDPNFRTTADAYYQVLANQARDLNLSISEVARLNSLMERDQAIEIGKLNEARDLIISKNQAENQAVIDSYNASILQEINAYGPNFEAIIRNINDQALLTGHTFLYGTTPAALYEQLHMEMPELELVDPADEIDEKDQPDATWHPGKGRKVGDTAIYSYRYNLTDEQNQELDELARREYFINDPEEMKRRAALIYERDRHLYEQTDQERADDLGMTLEDYYAKYGIPVDPATIPIPDFNGTYPKNGKVRMPNGNIETYKDGKRTKVETPEVPYNPDLPQQPNGNVVMPDGSVRTYLDGLVTFVRYKDTTPEADRLTPDQINERERPTTPTEPITPEPVEPITPEPDREPTYEELKVMYPDKYTLFSSTYKSLHPQASQETVDKQTELYLKQQYGKNPVPLPAPQPVQPKQQVLFSGDRTMPDGTTRVYVDGKIVTISYPPGFPANQRQKLDKQSLANLNKQEGLYYVESDAQPETPTQPTSDGQLKNGNVVMPNGSTRKYVNGLVVQVSYPGTIPHEQQLSPQQINDAEGVRPYTYIGPETPVETPSTNLKQGLVTMPDGSKLIYKDGLVVSVSYPEGKTGPTINEINTRDGVQTGTREPTYAELQVMYKTEYEYKQRNRPDSVVEAELRELYKTEPVPIPGTTPAPAPAAAPAATPAAAPAPAPGNTTAQSLNLAVAPMAAPATTSMPEDTTPGIAY